MNISGSGTDPRRNLANIKGYTRKQLTTYLNELNRFQQRSTSYVSGVEGAPISRNKWRRYKQLEQRFGKRARSQLTEYGAYRPPNLGMTIAQREAQFTPENVFAAGRASNKPFHELDRRPENITSERALDKLIKQMETRLKPQYFEQTIRRQRSEMKEMLDSIGSTHLKDAVSGLSDKQFDVMWNYTNMAGDLAQIYELLRSKNIKITSMISDQYDEVLDAVKWAKTIT